MIRAATASDAGRIAAIYNHYVCNTIITFEEEEVSVAEIAARISEVQQAGIPWLVAEHDQTLIGYAHASKWKGRCAYRHSVETTVYLDPAYTGQGWGSKLYTALLDALQTGSLHVHAAIGGIALPNDASIALHEKFGMRKVAHFPEVGFKFNKWIDVGYWQITFN